MTFTATTDWMVDTIIDGVSVKDRWIVPHNILNEGTVYAGQLVGNSQECMPWDNSLNVDVKWLRDYHYVVINKLGSKDTRKFSMRTPT